jgi:hypothetical protein
MKRAAFWQHVLIGNSEECWEWQGYITEKGYGRLHLCEKGKYRFLRAHRFAWELMNGPIPEGQCICHHCDNRLCCNPAHLFMGTINDNNLDRARKGRGIGPGGCMGGENNPRAKLTEAQVREIRRSYAAGEATRQELGHRYGIHRMTVGQIIRRERWASIAP